MNKTKKRVTSMDRRHHIPTVPLNLLTAFGKMLLIARKEKRWRQADLAERLGIARQTIARMEHGDPTVAIGCYYTAAWLLDIPILPGMDLKNSQSKSFLSELMSLLQEKLPTRVVKKQEKPVDDKF